MSKFSITLKRLQANSSILLLCIMRCNPRPFFSLVPRYRIDTFELESLPHKILIYFSCCGCNCDILRIWLSGCEVKDQLQRQNVRSAYAVKRAFFSNFYLGFDETNKILLRVLHHAQKSTSSYVNCLLFWLSFDSVRFSVYFLFFSSVQLSLNPFHDVSSYIGFSGWFILHIR